MQAELDRRMKEEEDERVRGEEEAKERAVKDFELLQMGLEIRSRNEKELNPRAIFGMGPPKVVGRENGKLILEEVVEESSEGSLETVEDGDETKRGKKRKFELDEEELMRLAREERQRAKTILDSEKVLSPLSPHLPLPYIDRSPAVCSVYPKAPLLLGSKSHPLRRGLRYPPKTTKTQPCLPRLGEKQNPQLQPQNTNCCPIRRRERRTNKTWRSAAGVS